MILKKLSLKDYRNIKDITINPCENINVIYGNNAQGKTNIIESIWLFTGNQSFRNSKMSELINFDSKIAKLDICFEDRQRQQNAVMKISKKREYYLNRVPLKNNKEIAGKFYCIVFSPSHLEFIQGSPKNRRKFIDLAISQIQPQYLEYLSRYEEVLEQRNALLKDIPKKSYLKETIEIWDMQLAKLGTIISIYRNDYVMKLNKIASPIYSGLSKEKEIFNIKYLSSAFDDMNGIDRYDDKYIDLYYEKLRDNLEQDIRYGFTGIGVHRDDLDVFINQLSVKTYGSQGQQRSCVVAIKLAEADLLKAVTGENPIILLDDVMSELDVDRQDYILNHVRKKQVFITCCDVFNTIHLKKGKIFKIESGKLLEEQEVNI